VTGGLPTGVVDRQSSSGIGVLVETGTGRGNSGGGKAVVAALPTTVGTGRVCEPSGARGVGGREESLSDMLGAKVLWLVSILGEEAQRSGL
jgi:hypothetical protein